MLFLSKRIEHFKISTSKTLINQSLQLLGSVVSTVLKGDNIVAMRSDFQSDTNNSPIYSSSRDSILNQ